MLCVFLSSIVSLKLLLIRLDNNKTPKYVRPRKFVFRKKYNTSLTEKIVNGCIPGVVSDRTG